MLFLILDIPSYRRHLRFADRKSSVSILPFKLRMDDRPGPISHARRELFEKLGNVYVGTKFCQDMDVVLDSANLEANTSKSADDSTRVIL